ncbi:hypothetical protein WN55_03726 [Dufourea novaeangliae]|uniref:Uncharacterized protein n=1 Tax=Dufourea novaeangliae TaxID=178035 RepID=A0A154PK39_DUFNO|nr:hypothetical protein WN55_03726 [Dufourea novaeangliae]
MKPPPFIRLFFILKLDWRTSLISETANGHCHSNSPLKSRQSGDKRVIIARRTIKRDHASGRQDRDSKGAVV